MFSLALLPMTPITIIVIYLSYFFLQRYGGTPLQSASRNGHAEIVAMLLQAKGIDVNKEVSIIIPTPTISSPHTTTIHYR